MNNYRPTMKSIQKPSTKGGYRPTLESIRPEPEKEEYKIPEYPYATRPPTPEEVQRARQSVGQGMQGAAQSYLNTPEQIANVFGGHLYKPFSFAPQTPAAKAGGVAGDLASYFMPGGAVKTAGKFASLVPKVNELIKTGSEALKSRPITNFLANLGKNSGEAALYQKAKSPESRPLDVMKAGGIGGTANILANAMTNQNPLLKTAAKLGLGGLIGYQANGLPGAAEGAAASMFIPKALTEIGVGQKPIAAEMLTSEPTPEAFQKFLASRRLGDTGTPAEVFNSPMMGAKQGEISRSEAGGNAMIQLGENRIKQQQNAINNLLNTIFPNTKKANNEVSTLYRKAYQNNISQNALHDLMEDPVISTASKKVYEDPVYAKDLKNVTSDNFAYLDQVKRSIDDSAETALRAGENNKARIYRDSADKLTEVMDAEVPEYKMARDAAQKRIIRNQITERINKRAISGKNFYREFLSNENKFNDLMHDVRGNKDAQQMLKDMKLSWNNVIGYDTPATAAGMTAKHTNTAREGFQKFWNEFKDVFGAPRDVERAKFIQDPNWWSKFDDVMQYRNKLERQRKLADLVQRGISAGTLTYAKKIASEK